MKRFSLLLLIAPFCWLSISSVSAQSGRVKDASVAATTAANQAAEEKPSESDSKTPAQLYKEADDYTKNRFAEFVKRKMPYDTKLADKIRQEQRELAARYATLLAARKLEGKDVYYLGLLYNLARNNDGALEAMRRFLTENPTSTGEPAQNARAIVVIQAAKKGLLSEAETRLTEYAKSEPQVADDRYVLENWMASGYLKAKDYEHALPHAQEMLNAAKSAAAKKKSPTDRDRMLIESVVLLSEADLKLKKRDEAVAAVQELRHLALALPSGNLYKLALRRLYEISPNIDLFKSFDDTPEAKTETREIVAKEWIDQQPTKLADLRGRVVLLDFWAPWCGPCRATFPRLEKWHDSYKDKGLVVLGVTSFFGHAEGKQLTQPQELDYLRNFKKKFHLSYGFAVADSNDNDSNYGISSIPTTFLIDRRGAVRFISIGSSDEESAALGRMIKKLIEEPDSGIDSAKR